MNAPAYLPMAAAVAVLGTDATAIRTIHSAVVAVGSRPEIDLGRLPAPVAGKLDRWWDAVNAGRACRAVRVQTRLHSARQSYTKTRKKDLNDDYEALHSWPTTADAIDHILGANRCEATAAAHRLGATTDDVVGGWTWTLNGDGAGWPDLFGGPAWPRERARRLTVVVRDAAWRDRRLRRLAEVDVWSESVWPVPGPGITP